MVYQHVQQTPQFITDDGLVLISGRVCNSHGQGVIECAREGGVGEDAPHDSLECLFWGKGGIGKLTRAGEGNSLFGDILFGGSENNSVFLSFTPSDFLHLLLVLLKLKYLSFHIPLGWHIVVLKL